MPLYDFLKLLTYFMLLPVVFTLLKSVQFEKLFKKNYTFEMRVVYLFTAIIITKLVGDFFIDIMDILRSMFGIAT